VFNATPWPLSAREGDLVPIVQMAGLVSGSVWMGVESLSLLCFEPQTVHPVASCFTDCTVSVTLGLCGVIILFDSCCLQFPCLLVYDTYRTHSPDHPHVEGGDRHELSDKIRPLNMMYRKNGLFAVPVC